MNRLFEKFDEYVLSIIGKIHYKLLYITDKRFRTHHDYVTELNARLDKWRNDQTH